MINLKEYMSWFIRKEMKDKDIVGLSIALVDDQKIVWQQGFGYADRKNKIKATPDTVYRAGSISKLFNGMAAMKLAEAGKMNIDRPLVTYLPQFKIKSRFGNTDGITPRTILTHHSGLPSDWIDGMWAKHPKPFTLLVHEKEVLVGPLISHPSFFPYGKAGGLSPLWRDVAKGLHVPPQAGQLRPWRLGSEALRLLQHWGKMAGFWLCQADIQRTFT